MRLGGPLPQSHSDPDSWIAAVKERGYRAAYCPVQQRDNMLGAYAQAARNADVLIAEVGAWSNPLSDDDQSNGKLRMGMLGLEPLALAAHLATLTNECSGNDLPGTIISLLVSLFIWQ